jgi:hypothetical protein
MSNLYELTNEFNEIVMDLEQYELDLEVYQSTLDSLKAPIEEKVENIVKYMKSLEALAEAKKAEAKRLSESAASDLKKAEFFKNYMADNLKKANITKLQAGVFSLGWRKGTEVVNVDEDLVPETIARVGGAFRLKEPQPLKLISKTELKKILKEHPEIKIPGVSLVRNPDSLVVK